MKAIGAILSLETTRVVKLHSRHIKDHYICYLFLAFAAKKDQTPTFLKPSCYRSIEVKPFERWAQPQSSYLFSFCF